MSFGKKKKSSSSNNENTIRAPHLRTPFGSVTGNKKGDIRLTPKFQPGQEAAMADASASLGQIISGMPTTTDINQAFNNPFYDTLSQLQRNELGQEAEQARKALTEQQAARGNLNNSSGLYAQSLLERNIGDTLANNLLKARLGAFDAYNQNISNMMNRGAFFQNAMAGLQNLALRPLEIYQGIAPLGTQIQQYNNQANLMNQARQGGGGGGGLFSSLMGSAGQLIPGLLSGG